MAEGIGGEVLEQSAEDIFHRDCLVRGECLEGRQLVATHYASTVGGRFTTYDHPNQIARCFYRSESLPDSSRRATPGEPKSTGSSTCRPRRQLFSVTT